VRIGNTTVLPGDVVFGDREGVTFIPPHALKGLVDAARITHIHDEWTRKKFDEGKYKSTDIYGRPTDPALLKEYEEYLQSRRPK
jgi:regulator of RNase E activity RraA